MSIFSKVSSFLGRNLTMIIMDLSEFDPFNVDPLKAVKAGLADILSDIQSVLGDVLASELSRLSPGLSMAGLALDVAREAIGNEPKFYKFRINPDKLTVTKTKIQTVTAYGYDRFDLEFWGNQLDSYDYSGSTGAFITNPILNQLGIEDIRLSRAWLKFKSFDMFYAQHHKFLLVVFENEAMIGFFRNFNYTRDAHDPWQIKYSFSLNVFPGSVMDILSGKMIGGFLKKSTSALGVMGDFPGTSLLGMAGKLG
jgi:hypothetical protein